MKTTKKVLQILLPLVLLLCVFASCGSGSSAKAESTTTEPPFVDLVKTEGDWLDIVGDYDSAVRMYFGVQLSASLEGAMFRAKAHHGGLFVGEDGSPVSELEFASGDVLNWHRGEWYGDETFVDLIALKDGNTVGYATVVIRDSAMVEFAVTKQGDGYVAEVVECVNFSFADGKYTEVSSAQIEAELARSHALTPSMPLVNLYYEGTGFRTWNILAGSTSLQQVRLTFLGEDLRFYVRADGGELYDVADGEGWGWTGEGVGEKEYLSGSTVVWRGNSELIFDRQTQQPCNHPAYIEVTAFKGEDIVGYGLVKMSADEASPHRASIVACEELSSPITQAELEGIFAGLKG
ncbi:MAG: hypothetical protein IKM04_04600 [Clostridia bacterium]|nr:hypothetical protein [Clostridia bacterium]